MDVSINEKELINFFKFKAEMFRDLGFYLITCQLLIENFPEFNDEPFPALRSAFEATKEWILEAGEGNGLDENKLSEDFEEQSLDFYQNGIKRLHKIKLDDKRSFTRLFESAVLVMHLYDVWVAHYLFLLKSKECFNIVQNTDTIGNLLTRKAYELIGYWTAKMEEKRRNLESARTKTKRRLENKDTIRDLLEKSNYNIDRNLLITAQRTIDRGEKTVKNLIKEIIEDPKS